MVCLVYQGNDAIPVHINCEVSKQDAGLESALAKSLRKTIVSKPPRQGKFGIQSGLTVDKAGASHKSKDTRDDAMSAALQDIFLPSANIPMQAVTDMTTTDALDETDLPGYRHARGREVFGFQAQYRHAGLKSLIEHQQPDLRHETASKTFEGAPSKPCAEDRFAKRRRLNKTILKMNQASSGEEDEDNQDSDHESESDAEHDRKPGSDLEDMAHDANDPQKSFFEQDEMGAERYFQDLYQKSKTSNNTLSKLPTLEHTDFIKAIKQAPAKHSREMEMLTLLYEEQFPQWYFELLSGFNILIYGYGSKRVLLTKFATTVLSDAPLIIVNGYFPTLTVKEILDKISSTALGYSGPTGSLQEQIAFIRAYFSQPDRDVRKLYVLIHNIDGSSLRSEKCQSALSLLASCPNIHIIASVDHINANILWDTVKAARFRWVWHEITTFKPYLTETSFENSIMVRQGELGARGIQFVLASLTSNGKGLFKVLAEHQIRVERDAAEERGAGAVGKSSLDVGMAYNTLFRKCQENFLVSNAVTFRTQLTEFRDHRIVQSRKGPDGVEALFIPLSANILEGILEKMT
ncbi:Origin recognition complex subunit 2 [Haplosporangium sp. Z 767]|nr:Origin recognition complex subunit 2 [Haplosporangium sp. Z 767]